MSEAAPPDVRALRACFEGAIPAVMATSAADGTPNVAYVSQVYYVDAQHVALSFQFFNKTRANILAHPQAAVLVMDPVTARYHRLQLRYLRTETGGALFERMQAQLAGIASHTGMAGVFRLRGADVYRVEAVESLPGDGLPPPAPGPDRLAAVRQVAERLAACASTDALLQALMAALHDWLGVRHAMVLALDGVAGRLYTVASLGYAASGVGSEIALGEGLIGVAAQQRTVLRVGHMANVASYGHAVRASLRADAPGLRLDTEIPFPGLPAPQSQVALPLLSAGRLLGVLFAESPDELAFGFEDEDALAAIAAHLATAMDALQECSEASEPVEAAATAPAAQGQPLAVRHYHANDSVFVDGHYLIKGVAGAILAKLLREHQRDGRCEFSNRELRLDPALKLPDLGDNLEARLVLLQRRLQEQCQNLRIEKTGRGRFRLRVARPVALSEEPAP
ncbi:GAF domain-containing protein [Pseudorhodoferax sp.]|uniref:GAF domain-containing protein n=1 Tax=Pseudorhodoferax sp. TaxID=1993553 RepID=UPI002DD6BA69|nr:GAF domain-containing protein [Pseudorhodoferax sp.]